MFNAIIIRNKYILIIFIILFTCTNILFYQLAHSTDSYFKFLIASPPDVYRVFPKYIDEFDISSLNEDEYFYAFTHEKDQNGRIYVIDEDYKKYYERENDIEFNQGANYVGQEITSKGFFDFELIRDENNVMTIEVAGEEVNSKNSSIIFLSKEQIRQSLVFSPLLESTDVFTYIYVNIPINSERYNDLQKEFEFDTVVETQNNDNLELDFKTEFVYIVIGLITFTCSLLCSVSLIFINSRKAIKILYSLGYSLKLQTFVIINIVFFTYLLGFILSLLFINNTFMIYYFIINITIVYIVMFTLSSLLLLILGIRNIGRIT